MRMDSRVTAKFCSVNPVRIAPLEFRRIRKTSIFERRKNSVLLHATFCQCTLYSFSVISFFFYKYSDRHRLYCCWSIKEAEQANKRNRRNVAQRKIEFRINLQSFFPSIDTIRKLTLCFGKSLQRQWETFNPQILISRVSSLKRVI